MYTKKIGIIIAARTSSKRLPRKALLKIDDISMIEFLIKRIKYTSHISSVILATSINKEDDILNKIASKNFIECFKGSLEDVTLRFIEAAERYQLDYVIRVTGDCPFISSELIEYCLENININDNYHLYSTKGYFPVGLDIEIYNHAILKDIYIKDLMSKENKEHLTQYFYQNQKNHPIYFIKPKNEWLSKSTFTIDYKKDYEKFKHIKNDTCLNDLITTYKD